MSKYRFDSDGYDSDGYDSDGFNLEGFDSDGYNSCGFDSNGIHRDTGTEYDPDGFAMGYRRYQR